jgi:3-hydroxy acid dehydrogenase/malonic semialdehyde reductase
MGELSGFTAVVTGATSGFGAATARRLAAAGARLVLVGRRRQRLESVERALTGPVRSIPLDVRDRKAVFAAFAGLPDDFASVDILVNNAGLALGMEPAHAAEIADWEVMVDTNVKGLLYCTRAVLPGMVERNRGHIINVSSTAASYPYPGGNAYGGTKAFVKQFSLNLRADLAGTNVRVTDVAPGLAETEFSVVRFKGDAERAGAVYAGTTPLTAEDVADAIAWVATRPAHVNVNRIELMPTCQAFGPFAIHRRA